MEQGEHGGHPDKAQTAGPHQGDDHGDDGVADAPQAAHHGVHKASQQIGTADEAQTNQGLTDDLLLAGGVNAGQRTAEEIGQVAQYQAGGHGKGDAQEQSPIHTLALGRTVVLAAEGESRLVEGVHGGVDKILDVGGGGGAGHQGRVVKGVQGRLDDHVGQGEHDALESGGQPYLEDAPDHRPVQPQLAELQTEGTRLPHETAQDQGGGDVLGDDGGQGHAVYVHPETDDEA